MSLSQLYKCIINFFEMDVSQDAFLKFTLFDFNEVYFVFIFIQSLIMKDQLWPENT